MISLLIFLRNFLFVNLTFRFWRDVRSNILFGIVSEQCVEQFAKSRFLDVFNDDCGCIDNRDASLKIVHFELLAVYFLKLERKENNFLCCKL